MGRIGKWRTNEGDSRVLLTIAAIIAVLLVVGTAVSALVHAFSFINEDKRTFPNGTSVNGIDISGMKRDEARLAIDGEIKRLLSEHSVKIHVEGAEDMVLDYRSIGLTTDADRTLDEAFSGGEHSLSLVYSEQGIRQCLMSRAEELEKSAGRSRIEFDKARHPAGKRFRFSSEGARELDVEACISEIMRGVCELTAPMKEASVINEPELPVLIAEFETSFGDGSLCAPPRVYNIEKAAELVNGSVVEPYMVLSMNEKLGERTKEKGWQDAPGITELGADTIDQPGGGVCQVSGTVFNAGLLAGMNVISRQAHSRPVAYLDMGRDATIDTDSFDLVLKNRSDSALYVFVWTDEENFTCRCEIYGKPLDSEIEVVTELVETVEPTEDEYMLDPSLGDYECIEENPAITGYLINTYRIWSENGQEERRELVAESRYYMHPRRLRVGSSYYARVTGQNPTPRPVQTPRPTPTPGPSTTPEPTQTPETTPAPEPTAEQTQEPLLTPFPTPAPGPGIGSNRAIFRFPLLRCLENWFIMETGYSRTKNNLLRRIVLWLL